MNTIQEHPDGDTGATKEALGELALQRLLQSSFDTDRDGMTRAMASLLDDERQASMPKFTTLYAWLLRPSHALDIVLANERDEVVMVIELKLSAAENILWGKTVAEHVLHDETYPLAAGIVERTRIRDDEARETHDWSKTCACSLHRFRRGNATRGAVGISQFDAYLTFAWFDRAPIEDGPSKLTIPAKRDVQFLYLNASGKSVAGDHVAEFGSHWSNASLGDLGRAMDVQGAHVVDLRRELARYE